MADEEFIPIRIKISEAIERRFARFDIASDNSPSEPDGSIPINGSVAFGMRRQKGQKDRVYTIGIKFAFLEIKEVNCQFDQTWSYRINYRKAC